MSSNFPLFDSLIKDIKNEELTTKEKDEFMKLIKNLDQDGYELVYALIRVYQNENSEDKSTFKIPYGGVFVKSDINFNLNDLPHELMQIIYKFAVMHAKSMKEKEKSTETMDETE